jgi:hypothetical protein
LTIDYLAAPAFRSHWERRHPAGRLTLTGEPAGWKPALPVLAPTELIIDYFLLIIGSQR